MNEESDWNFPKEREKKTSLAVKGKQGDFMYRKVEPIHTHNYAGSRE